MHLSRRAAMKVMMLLTGSGSLVILTSHESAAEPGLVKKLKAKGIHKFVAMEIPLEMAKERYGAHFFVVEHDVREDDALRVVDYDGAHAFGLFRFDELGPPLVHEPAPGCAFGAAEAV
jgi:hypothetical protein